MEIWKALLANDSKKQVLAIKAVLGINNKKNKGFTTPSLSKSTERPAAAF